MSSLVERLRVRSDRKPIYNIDESDDDADLLPGKHGTTQEKFEKIVRTDAVCFFYLVFSPFFNLLPHYNAASSYWILFTCSTVIVVC